MIYSTLALSNLDLIRLLKENTRNCR